MSFPVGGIDPHQDTFTVGIVDENGVEIVHEAFANTAAGYGAAIGLLAAHGANRVGVEGSAKWGAHAAILSPAVRPPPRARTASAGSRRSSTKTAPHAGRSAASNGSPASCRTATAPLAGD